jgi:uncharacterized membrane protein YgcG
MLAVSKARHAVVGLAIGFTTLLAGLGVIGGGDHPERFDAKTVVIARDGERAIRITEYVDIDFGSANRRGYERLVPNDFGVPTDVVASSPDAAADLNVSDLGGYTQIRVGDPNTTWTGQHRYELAYTLPDARYDAFGSEPQLVVDVVSPPGGAYPGDDETGRFQVVVTGYVLTDLRCDVGALGAEGGCELVAADDGTYRAVIEPLDEDDGLTVGGTIEELVAPVAIPAPAIPDRRDPPNRALIAVAFAGLGLLGAVPVHRWAQRRGRNEVFGGGAADAAFGDLPPPGADGAPSPVRLVTDDDLGELATIEFAPPKGIEPWEASVLLRERVDDDTVEAWFSGMVGREALTIDADDGKLVLASGPRRSELTEPDAELVAAVLAPGDPYTTGTYDRRFASAWRAIHRSQQHRIGRSGWWKHLPPGTGFGRRYSGSPFGLVMLAVFVLIWGGSAVTAAIGGFQGWPISIAIAVGFPAVVAYFAYRVLLPARSAPGSALALRTESFRRFLHASEGHHVEWAWSQGLLREYSAWAVALGEADAWSRALERANVPAPAVAAAAPLILYGRGASLRQSRTAPSSGSGGRGFGGGGGGFGGGGVGGGGGGGSSGSW